MQNQCKPTAFYQSVGSWKLVGSQSEPSQLLSKFGVNEPLEQGQGLKHGIQGAAFYDQVKQG